MRKTKRWQFSLEHQEARQKAFDEGLKHFEGDACVKCGSHTRYVSEEKCVACKRRAARKASDTISARTGTMTPAQARELGLIRYDGAVHEACGTTLRFSSCGSCVHCTNQKRLEDRRSDRFVVDYICEECGDNRRYANGDCVSCRRSAAYKEKKEKELEIPRLTDPFQALLSRSWAQSSPTTPSTSSDPEQIAEN